MKVLGVKKIIMLMGDKKFVVISVGKVLGLDEIYVELFFEDKLNKVEEFLNSKLKWGKFFFVGDGINDILVFVRVDIGIVMGGFGVDVVIDVVDIVIMIDELLKIVIVVKIVRWIRKIVW